MKPSRPVDQDPLISSKIAFCKRVLVPCGGDHFLVRFTGGNPVGVQRVFCFTRIIYSYRYQTELYCRLFELVMNPQSAVLLSYTL